MKSYTFHDCNGVAHSIEHYRKYHSFNFRHWRWSQLSPVFVLAFWIPGFPPSSWVWQFKYPCAKMMTGNFTRNLIDALTHHWYIWWNTPAGGTCSLWITFISLSGCSHGLVMYVDNNCSILRAAMLWGRGVVSYREWEWDVIVILWMRSYESERTMRCETYEKFRTLFRPGKKGRIVKKLWFGAGGEYYKIIITAA